MADYFDDALRAYRERASVVLAAAPAAGLEAQAEPSDEQVDQLLADSQALENGAAQDLAAGDGDVREAATLKLVAGAALDLAAAEDLLRRGDVGEAATAALAEDAGAAGSAWQRTYHQLADVLEAPTALGARAPFAAEASIAAAALEDADPVAALRAAAHRSIAAIAGDARAIVTSAIDGLQAVPLDALASAFGSSADKLLTLARSQVSRIVRLAMRFVAKAVSKLLRLLGPLEPAARRWLRRQLERVRLDGFVGLLLDRLLAIGKIGDDVDASIAAHGAGADEQRLRAASEELEALRERFGRHRKVVTVLAGLLDKVAGVLIALASWAAAALAGVLLLMLAYGVWVAGDFLDWYRTRQDGRLDLVAGVRAVVAQAVGAPEEDTAEAAA